MLYTKYRINFKLHKSKSNKKNVIIRVTSRGSREDLYTGITVTENQWDENRERIKHGCSVGNTTYNIINATLDKYSKFINEYFSECAMRDVHPSLPELKKRFNKKFKMSDGEQSDEFFYLFDEFIKEKSKERGWGDEMTEAYTRLRNIIKEFKPDIKFSDLSVSTMNSLLEHMSRTMFNDALSKRLSYLKSFIKWAKGKKYVINEEYFSFIPKLLKAKKAVRYLELEELYKISEMDFPNDSTLDRVRDMFIFQCYTALRFSDLKALKHENIHYDSSKNSYSINLVTEKNNKRICFPLSQRATAIYLKYKDRMYNNGLVFPVISNQKYNEHLKELGELADLKGEWIDYEYRLNEKIIIKTPKKDLSSHTARRTFVVTAINANIDYTLIALVTSHSDFKSMAPYIAQNSKGAAKVIDAIDNAERKTKEVALT